MRLQRMAFTAAALSLALIGRADAGILLGSPLNATVGSGVANASALTTTPNNYPTASSSNNLTTSISLTTSTGPLDLILAATNSGGTTQYTATSSVINSSGTAFSGFEFELGTGTGAGFVPFASTSSLSFFTTPPTPSSATFTSAAETAGTLIFSGGSMASGSTSSFTFAFALSEVPGTVGTPFTFTLRELAITTVPEPASLGMLATGAVGVGLALIRRRRGR